MDETIIKAEEIEIIQPTVVEALTRGEIDVQIATARRFRRSMGAFMQNAKGAVTASTGIAEGCFFDLPRDGKAVSGPSIRLAEIAAQYYGNLRLAGRVIEVGERDVVAQGVAFDLENNVAFSTEVRRSIMNKYGKRFNDNMIQVTCMAAVSIALRNAIFRVVPRPFVEELEKAARAVVKGDVKTFNVRRDAAIAWFADKQTVKVDRILKALEKNKVEDITGDDLVTMTGWKTSLLEGHAKVDEIFPIEIETAKPAFPQPAKDPVKETPQDATTTTGANQPATEAAGRLFGGVARKRTSSTDPSTDKPQEQP